MTYFNGSGGYMWLGEYVPLVRTTVIACDDCARKGAVPLDKTAKRGQEHWKTDFKWAPYYGAPCTVCGKPS
jgi:hypothetical protein